MHLIDTDAGVMGTSAVVGTTIANSVGYAYALKYRRSDAIVASFFGDGATEEGVFHESVNFAALKRLPILFICENNSYAIHTHQLRRQALANIAERVRSYGIPAQRIDDGDVLSLHEQVRQAVSELRSGKSGPIFFECKTYRWKEHVGPGEDWQLGYRMPQEAEPWREHDPLTTLAAQLDADERRRIESDVECEIEVAFAFAEVSPEPKAEALFADVAAPLLGNREQRLGSRGQRTKKGRSRPVVAATSTQARPLAA